MTIEEELDFVITQIRKIRMSKKISQAELADRGDFSQCFLANLESGKKKPSLLTVLRLARTLEVSAREFFPEGKTSSKEAAKQEIIRLLNTM